MKVLLGVMVILMVVACSSKNSDWDSGGNAQEAYRQEQVQDQVESTRQQVPTPRRPSSDQSQPF